MEPNRTSRNNRMERSQHIVEDVSSSDEPDLKRPVSDNSASTTRKRESILKNVMVLFSCDVRKRDSKVYMPNTIEMARLKRPERGQFKTNIEFTKTMTEKDVKEKLRRHFPILGNNGRLSCATAADNRTRLEFHCSPQTVWDGNKINRHIRGNSALYVLCEGTPESVSERPESSTVDSFLQQLQTPTPEPMGSPLAYSGKLKSLKRKHYSSSSSVPEVVPNRGASVKKQGLKQSSGGDYSKESQEVNNLKVRRSIESNNSSDSAFESSIVDASGVDDNTEHSKGKIEEAACSHIAQLERYLKNSETDPSEGSSWEEIDLNRRAAGDQICLSDRELNEAYQDVQEMFSPVIKLLCPDEGPITGNTKFVVCLNARRIPENLTSLRALFKGVGFADLTLVTEGVYTGLSPAKNCSKIGCAITANSQASKILGKVAVTVGSLDGTWNTLDETEFEYHLNVTQELQKLISKMPGTKRNIPLDYQTLNPACSAGTVSSPSSFSPEVDRPLMADESKDILSLKALQCILFAAATTNDRECIEIIFSTSAGEAVFQTYRNSSILPEDTARAKGHQNLAKYLQNVHKRLSREIVCDVQNVTIDWLELKRATAKKDIFSGTDESQGLELEMENDDDQSSYFADDETSICQSPSTTEFSNEDECIESKYTDDAEMLEHSRCENNHGHAYDKFQLSLPSVDEVFESLNDDQVKSANDRELSSNQEVKDSTLGEIMNVSSRVNQEGTSPGVTISQVSVNATVPVAGEILNSTVGAFEGMVKCKAVLHSQKRFGFTITVPLSEDRESVQRLNSPFIQKKVKNGKAAQEGTSKSHEEPHGSKLSHILRGNPEFIEQLSLCLDRDMRLIHNWKHLASTLEVEVDVIKRLEQYGDFSPTFRLFYFLESWKPDLTIKELKETMLEIGRNDLLNLLTTEVVCIDSEKVVDVITKPSEAPSPRAGILDELALALDGRSLVLSNWYTLAIKLGVQRITCWTFERRSTENPTGKLFQYLATSCPQLTLNSLKEALDSIDRRDLMNFLKNKNLGDEVLLKDVITPGSELLEKISQELNRDDNIGVKNYVHLARKLEVPAEILRQFADVQQCRKSPTKEVLEWVAARFPETTLSDIAQALEKIQRNDAIQIISRHFPNTIGMEAYSMHCMNPFRHAVLSTGSPLGTILAEKRDLMDRLALLLDRKMRLIPNWTQLARELRVDDAVISRLEQYSNHSPTIQLFDYLEVKQPNLSIQQLRKGLTQINRNDLNVLLTNAGFDDHEKVRGVITSGDPQTQTSLKKEIFDKIALALDGTSLVLGNWYSLAIKFDVSREECWKIGAPSVESPTNQLFQYLEATCPKMKLKKVVDALCLMTRHDLLDFIAKQNFEDEVLLKDVMIPGSKMLQTMADKLNRTIPAVENWKSLAFKLEIPNDEIRKFEGMTRESERTSPTIEVMKWVAAKLPDTCLTDVVRALDKIQRNDAVIIITEEFPDIVDQSLERLDSSLHDSLIKEMPINDPTGRTLSYCRKGERSVSLSSKVAEDMIRTGHCGLLPERTSLVGRSEICEDIVTLLTSNKSAEIVAPPGYGKTTVVIEVAYRMIERGKFIAYVKPRNVTCVEDLAGKIIEALGFVHGEDAVTEVFHRICYFKEKSVVLIIENIDDLLHLENQISVNELHQELKSKTYFAKMRGKYSKDDFFTFLKDIGLISNVQLILTSRETYNFPIEVIDLGPLNDEESAVLFTKSDGNLDDSLIKELVRVCGGIPLIICTVLFILKWENPKKFTERLSSSSPSDLVRELNPEFMANEDRIDKCLEICFKRLSQENQKILVMFSTFPYRFTQEQFQTVFESSVGHDFQTHLNCLKQSSLLHFDRKSCQYSLHPFIRNFFSLMPDHNEAKSVFLRHYSDLAVSLCRKFLGKDSKCAIEHYRAERENIREAMAWCGDEHPELEQSLREKCINAFNKAAVFLAKMMKRQEFESLFCKLAHRCRYDMPLYSTCLTHIGMNIVSSCTCTPFICSRALYRAKSLLSDANDIQSERNDVNNSNRAQCLSKLGFCCVREGRVEEGYEHLEKALKLRWERAEKSNNRKDKVMLAACLNDLAASQMVQRNHLLAIQTRLDFVLPIYKENLGDHPFTATTLNWIGNSYYALGDYTGAIKYSSTSVNLRRQLLGQHQETAKSLYDLGEAFSAKGDYQSALDYLKEAAKLQEEVLDTHDELIHTYQTLSIVLRYLGREKEAEEEVKKAEECAKNLDSWKAPLKKVQSHEGEKGWMAVSTIPDAQPRSSAIAETKLRSSTV